jgi:hypothetical protein
MKRRVLFLAAAFALTGMSLIPPSLSSDTCDECAQRCSQIPQETAACMEACCGSVSPVGGPLS